MAQKQNCHDFLLLAIHIIYSMGLCAYFEFQWAGALMLVILLVHAHCHDRIFIFYFLSLLAVQLPCFVGNFLNC